MTFPGLRSLNCLKYCCTSFDQALLSMLFSTSSYKVICLSSWLYLKVFPLIALVTSAIVLGKIAELDSRVKDALNDNEDVPDDLPPAPDTPNLVTISQGVSSIIILAAIAIILYQTMLLLLRCLGLEVCNRIFIIAVVMVSPCQWLQCAWVLQVHGRYKVTGW